MEWIQANWIWILFGVAFFAMHMFGHGGHRHGGGRHSAHGPGSDDQSNEPMPTQASAVKGAQSTQSIADASSHAVPIVAPHPTDHNSPANPKDGNTHRHGC